MTKKKRKQILQLSGLHYFLYYTVSAGTGTDFICVESFL